MLNVWFQQYVNIWEELLTNQAYQDVVHVDSDGIFLLYPIIILILHWMPVGWGESVGVAGLKETGVQYKD